MIVSTPGREYVSAHYLKHMRKPVNFVINANFKWVLLGMALLWACSLVLFWLEKRSRLLKNSRRKFEQSHTPWRIHHAP